MANAMRKLAEDPDLRKRMGEAGRKRVLEHFTWEKKGEFIKGYIKRYMNILCVHNYYQNPGGEDSVFASEKLLLESNDNTVIQYIEDNNKLNNTGKLKSAYNTIWSSGSKQKIYQLLQKEKPDVAHFHNTFLLISPSAYYACKKAGVPVVQTLHNYRLLCPSAILLQK
jgi:glycosyltransferase involved in cell wall biosynthesis